MIPGFGARSSGGAALSLMVAVAVAVAVCALAGRAGAQESAPGTRGGAGAGASGFEPPVVRVTLSPDSATVGDRLFLRMEVTRPEGLDVAYPDVAAAVAPLEVLDLRMANPRESGGRVVEYREYVLAAFETGPLGVSPMRFVYVDAAGDTASVVSDSMSVSIVSVLPEVREHEEVGPKDIKPPIELPRRVWPYVVVALVAAAAAAAGHYLRKWLRGRGERETEKAAPEPAVPRRAAHVVAMERLERLWRDDPIGRGDVPAFYVRVTEIVRLYLRDRFDVDAIDMTTAELGPAMRDAQIEPSEVEWSVGYMLHADLAKFAKHVPGEERARADYGDAVAFVERTRFRDGEDDGLGVAAGVDVEAVGDAKTGAGAGPESGEEEAR
jgi:hypothetical protein